MGDFNFLYYNVFLKLSIIFFLYLNSETKEINMTDYLLLKTISISRDAWVAQSVKQRTLDFGSGHDLTVSDFKPRMGLCADGAQPAWDSLSPCLSAPSLLPLSLSLSKIKKH